ncbi:ran-binding protein 3-like isoform X3 [Microtus pennsylvanicus]|uniref:ran-binding protein 3-like isoform X3 n=1 Tax=Microtus pennsylvanicus TaxID=10058 RepID=UPI003F6C5D2C
MSTTQRKDDSHLFASLCTCQLKVQEDQQQPEKYVIAQPTFVFEKKEHTFKRPAEDSLDEMAEHEFSGFSRKRIRSSSVTLYSTDSKSLGVAASSQTRLRSSSFTDAPTFPPSGPVKKNNVFMTSSLVQGNIDMSSIEQGSVRPSEHVLRPAILQPPQTQSCKNISKTFGHGELKSCKIKENIKHKISDANSGLQSENLPNASSVQLSTDLHVSEETSGCQPTEDKRSFQSCTSDFVFGENMVERVLINCKIFVFTKITQSWTERGRGILRLNDIASGDCGTLQSRLIMRNQGNLRLVLNSRLWTQMKIQRANHRNLRMTATDLEDDGIKIFLIQASAKDIGYLYAAIHHRLVALRSLRKRADGDPVDSQSDTVLQQFSCDEDEEDFIQVTKNGSGPSRWNYRQSVVCS